MVRSKQKRRGNIDAFLTRTPGPVVDAEVPGQWVLESEVERSVQCSRGTASPL
jgi:hypothetical protein